MKTKRWKRLYGQTVKFVCPYCLKEKPLSDATKDHKNPYSRFHDNSPENIVLCCRECNNEKGALTVAEYAEWKRLEAIRNGNIKGR